MLIHVENLRRLLKHMILTDVTKETGIDYGQLRRFVTTPKGRPSANLVDRLRIYFAQRAPLYSSVPMVKDFTDGSVNDLQPGEFIPEEPESQSESVQEAPAPRLPRQKIPDDDAAIPEWMKG